MGWIQPRRLWRPRVSRVRDPNNVGRAVQTDPILLRYALVITEQKKFWKLSAQKSDWFQQLPTTRNNIQLGVDAFVTFNNVGGFWPTMLRPFARGLKGRN